MRKAQNDYSNPSRKTLITVALKLFAEQGFDGTTTRDIAKVARLNISLIAYHFGGKEGLLQECLIFAAQSFGGKAIEELTNAETKEEFHMQIQNYVTSLLKAHVSLPHVHKFVQRELDRGSPTFRAAARDQFARYFLRTADFFATGQRAGYLDPSIDPMNYATALNGAIVQQTRLDHYRAKINNHTIKDPATLEKVASDIANIFSRGLILTSTSVKSS